MSLFFEDIESYQVPYRSNKPVLVLQEGAHNYTAQMVRIRMGVSQSRSQLCLDIYPLYHDTFPSTTRSSTSVNPNPCEPVYSTDVTHWVVKILNLLGKLRVAMKSVPIRKKHCICITKEEIHAVLCSRVWPCSQTVCSVPF